MTGILPSLGIGERKGFMFYTVMEA